MTTSTFLCRECGSVFVFVDEMQHGLGLYARCAKCGATYPVADSDLALARKALELQQTLQNFANNKNS